MALSGESGFAKRDTPAPPRRRRLVLFALALLGAYLSFSPLRLSLPELGLDPSWHAVLLEAASRHLSMGRDLIFTSGPLSSLYTGYLDEELFWLKLGLHFLLVIAFAWLVAFLAISRESRFDVSTLAEWHIHQSVAFQQSV
jgi:hypothetical protein